MCKGPGVGEAMTRWRNRKEDSWRERRKGCRYRRGVGLEEAGLEHTQSCRPLGTRFYSKSSGSH